MAALGRAWPFLAALVAFLFFTDPSPQHFGCLQTEASMAERRVGKPRARGLRKISTFPKTKTTQAPRRSPGLQAPRPSPPMPQHPPVQQRSVLRISTSETPSSTLTSHSPPSQAPLGTRTQHPPAPLTHAQGPTQTAPNQAAASSSAPWSLTQPAAASGTPQQAGTAANLRGFQQPATETPATGVGALQKPAAPMTAASGASPQSAAQPTTAAAGSALPAAPSKTVEASGFQQPAAMGREGVMPPKTAAASQQTGAVPQPPAGAFADSTPAKPLQTPGSGFSQQPPAAYPYQMTGQQHTGYAYGSPQAYPSVAGQGVPAAPGVYPGHPYAAGYQGPQAAPAAAPASAVAPASGGPSLTRTVLTSAVGSAVGSMVGTAVASSIMHNSSGSKEAGSSAAAAPAAATPAAGEASSSKSTDTSKTAGASDTNNSSNGDITTINSNGNYTITADNNGNIPTSSSTTSSGSNDETLAASNPVTGQEMSPALQKGVSLPLFFLGVSENELESSVKGPHAFGQQVQDAVVQALGVPATRITLEEVSVKKVNSTSTTSSDKETANVTVRLAVHPDGKMASSEPTAGDLAAEVRRQLEQPTSYLSRLLRSAFSELPSPVTVDTGAVLAASAAGDGKASGVAAAATAANGGSPQGAAGLHCLLLLLGSTIILWI